MRNEEPTRTDPPPGFTGDLAADVGTSLGGMRAPRAASRTGRGPLRARRQELAALVLARCDLAEGHVELRRL